MASKLPFSIFSSLFSLLVILTLFSNATSAHSHHQINNSSVEFLKHLQGCHKGDKVKGIHDFKKYLEQFGYLNYNANHKYNQTHADDDDFDDLLESAVKTYQENFHLGPSGVLDGETVSKMIMPRCGVADITNGTNWMRAGKTQQRHNNRSTHFHTVSHYSFFPQARRWRESKFHLTYVFLPGTRAIAMTPVSRAFNTWAGSTHFKFSRTEDYQNADITISFHSRDHRDGAPFDGPGGTMAHAFAPEIGRFHYDADESWGVGARPGVMDLETVALHEIGHLLGLGHSDVEEAIMWPFIRPGSNQGLHADDIQGIRALYNV